MDGKEQVDPAVGRLTGTLDNARKIENAMQPVMAKYVGSQITSDSAKKVVGDLYDSSNFLKALAQYVGIADVEKLSQEQREKFIADFGIDRFSLERAILTSGPTFKYNTAEQVTSSLAGRYASKTLESEPVRLQNKASKEGISSIVPTIESLVESLGGKPAVANIKARLKNLTTPRDVGEFLGEFYGGAYGQLRAATPNAY